MGYNWRLDELQAAVLRVKLRTLEVGNARRRELARRYDALLAGSPARTVRGREGSESVHHLHPVRVRADDRDLLRDHLAAQGIETGIHYRTPVHRQPALRTRRHRCGRLAVTEEACGELLSLPMYPELTDAQLEYVAGHVRDFFATAAGTVK